jgi:hypothetical protein
MNTPETLICIQCGQSFEEWMRYEDWGWGEVGCYPETDVCSQECYDEWRSDNRKELCN